MGALLTKSFCVGMVTRGWVATSRCDRWFSNDSAATAAMVKRNRLIRNDGFYRRAWPDKGAGLLRLSFVQRY